MDSKYGDQGELAGALAHLADIHLGGARGPQGDPPFLPLRAGSLIVIVPAVGSFVHGARDAGPRDVDPRDLEMVRSSARDPSSDHRGVFGDDVAGLSCGLRPLRYRASNPRNACVDLLRDRAMRAGSGPAIKPSAWPVPREALGGGAERFSQSVMGGVRAAEDALCLEMLGELPPSDAWLECGGRITADALLAFLAGINSGQPSGARLDTAFASPANLSRLANSRGGGTGAGAPHPNVLALEDCTVIAHGGIPDDTVYLTSRPHGPALVRCPTAIRCGESELLVEHYCGKHAPGDAAAGLAAGLARAGGPARGV